MYGVHAFLLVNVVTTFGDIVFSEPGSDSGRRGGVSKPLSQKNSRPVPLNSNFLPRGCGDQDAFCDDNNYPDVNTIKRIVRANSSELELKLLFSKKVLKASTYTNQANQPVPINRIIPNQGSQYQPPPSQAPSFQRPAPKIPRPEQGRIPSETAEVVNRLDTTRFGSPLLETDEVISSETTVNLDPLLEEINPIVDSSPHLSAIEEKAICTAHESFIYPKTAKNIVNEWRYVVNIEDDSNPNDNYLQAVRIERCSREGESCEIETGLGIQTVCRQKYSEKKLVAISPEGEKYVDTFRLPSCCICYKKENFRLELSSHDVTRINLGAVPKKKVSEDSSAGVPALEDQVRDDGDRGQETGFGTPKSVEQFDDPLDLSINFGPGVEIASRRRRKNL